MSVPVQNPINQVVIVGGETLIPWTWNLQKEEEITVLVQRALDGSIDTLTLNSDYTVEANDLDNNNGGNITPIGSESPVTTGDIWTLFRVTAIDRSPDFATSGAFFALTINEQLDELTRIAQDINRDSAEAVRKDPGVGDTLDRNIPQPVDRRALVFSDKGSGDFEMVMSEFDPDTTAADSAASAAAAAASAAAASSSASNAANSETNAAQSASDASDSADEAAASALAAAGLYGQVLEVNTNTVITSSQGGFLINVDTSGGDIDITLPDSASLAGDFRVAVAKLTSDLNVVNVKVAGSDIVNGTTANIVQDVQFRITDYVLDQSKGEYTASPTTAPVTSTGLYSTVLNAQSEPFFSGESFSVLSQEGTPRGLIFNNDGTKFFIVGSGNNTVFEYTVSVGFDLSSTVAFSGESFSVASEDTSAQGLVFNSDGTKMFILGSTNDRVFEYTLSVGFDLSSTVTFTTNSFLVSGQDSDPRDLAFNVDGTKMFILGNTNSTVFEYTLSIGFDLSSTVTFTGNSFSIMSEEATPTGLAFNTDGTKMFIVGVAADTVFEYTLSVGFDLSSIVTFTGNSFSITSEDTGPQGLVFNADGTKLFMVGNTNDSVFEYFTPAFDISSAVVFTGNSFNVVAQETSAEGLAFNLDGTKMFIVGGGGDAVFEYTLSVGFDLSSTVAFSGNSFSVLTQEPNSGGLAFNSDGTKFFIVGTTNDTVFEYTVSVGFDLGSTVAFSGNSFSVASQETAPLGVAFNADGTKMFIVGPANATVFEYSLSIGFDLSSTVTFTGNSFSAASQDTGSRDVNFNPGGTKMFIVGSVGNAVYEYTLSVGFDLNSTVTFTGNSFSVAAELTAPQAVVFNSDGSKMFVMGSVTDTVFEYKLRNAFNVFNGIFIDSTQDGFLFLALTGANDLNIQLPETADVTNGFRVGIMKITSLAGDIVVSVLNVEDINLAASITLATQFKNALCSADVDDNRYFADVG